MSKTKYQKSEKKLIKRSELKDAPYNPRVISDYAKKHLKKNFKKVGFLGGIIWNEKTKHILSGHQRLSVLDMLEGNTDYEIEVDVVNLDEKTEKEQNIFMNSTTVQGEFNLPLLNDLLNDIDIEFTGLDENDLQIIGYDAKINETETDFDDESDYEDDESETEQTIEDKAQKIKDLKKDIQNKMDNKSETEPYVMISFQDAKEKQLFMKRLSFPENDNILDARAFRMKLNKLFDIKL